jgi:hypothetical protein
MQAWEYKVAFVDYRGRISVEGHETVIANERRTAFVRRFLDSLGSGGWELVGIQPLGPQSAYYLFKRPGRSAGGETQGQAQTEAGARADMGGYAGGVEAL